MDVLDNFFAQPTRRDLLRWGAACGAAGALCSLKLDPALAQDLAGGGPLPGPKLKGVVRHPAMFWENLGEKNIKCVLCPRECMISDVERGYCGVRENRDGEYQTLVYGALCSANVDPIEKKPLFHYLPGTAGIFHRDCGLQYRVQVLPKLADQSVPARTGRQRSCRAPIGWWAACKSRQAPTIAYTYSEPVIFYEYMHDCAALAREDGIGSVMISNGYIQEKPLRQLCRHLTAVKIDLKAFTEEFYAETCAGELSPILKTLEILKDIGIWFELVILVVPTLNDSPNEIKKMSEWVVGRLGPGVPMHFTRFHPTYRITNLPSTPVSTLDGARRIAMQAGVRYAYVGNVPMHPGENTFCHGCNRELIRRVGYRIKSSRITDGKCPDCGTPIPGIWSSAKALAFKPREKVVEPTRPTQPS